MAQRRRSNPGAGAEAAHQIYSEVADVGKHVTGTKKRAVWKFCFGEDGEEHQVTLIHSVVSGKKVIEFDGREILNVQKIGTEYSHTWMEYGRVFRLEIQELQDYPYLFSIDNIPFRALPMRGVSRMPMQKQRSSKTAEFSTSSHSHQQSSVSSGSTPTRRKSQGKSAMTAPAASQKTFDPFALENTTPQSAPPSSRAAVSADPFATDSFAAFPPASSGKAANPSAFGNDVWGAPAAATTSGATAGAWAAFPPATSAPRATKADEIINDLAGLTFEDVSQKRAQEEKEARERQLQQQREQQMQRQQEEEAAQQQKKKGVDAWEVASSLVASGNLLDDRAGLKPQTAGAPRSSPSLNQLAGKGSPAPVMKKPQQPMMGPTAALPGASTATTTGMGYDVLTPASSAPAPAGGPAHAPSMAYQPRGSAAISMMNMEVAGPRAPMLGMGAMPPYHPPHGAVGMPRGPAMGGMGVGPAMSGGPGMGGMGGMGSMGSMGGMGAPTMSGGMGMGGMGGAGMGGAGAGMRGPAMGGAGAGMGAMGGGAMGRGAAGGMGGGWGSAQQPKSNSLDTLDAFRGL